MNAIELADIQAFKTEELTIWERNTTATMLRQQQAEIEALKRKWLDACDGIIELKQRYEKTQADTEYEIDKLYWRRRTLTDEEISEVFKDCTKDGILDANDFARAILRKAQEK